MPKNALKSVLILTQYDMPANKRNMNAYQRIFWGAEHARVRLLMRKGKEVSEEIKSRVALHYAPVQNRWFFLAYAVLYAGFLRLKGCRIVFTEPSGFAAVGFLSKYFFGYTWIMDVWDRPRWRAGRHEEGDRPFWSDRLVFSLMKKADKYVLSVLPRAAKDIDPPAEKCRQFKNAIDLSGRADHPPQRGPEDVTLHVAFAKSIFKKTAGLDMLMETARILKERDCPVVIHLVGIIDEDTKKAIQDHPAGDLFNIHGFIKETRMEFFSKIHAGMITYTPYEDVSYIFPIKVIEHLSQGNPVIASNLPGIVSMVRHEYNGLLFEPANAEDLVEKIQRLQRDVDLFNGLAAKALESSGEYDDREKNKKIYEFVLSGG